MKVGISGGVKLINFKDDPRYKFGHVAELETAQTLQNHGAYIIPSYDYSGQGDDKAPRLSGLNESFVVPDLDVAAFGKRIWVEVKRKTAASLHRISGDYTHGIPIRHYTDYLKVEQITGCEVWIVFHDNEGIKCGKLSSLKIHHRYNGDKMSRGGMVFFNITHLLPIETLLNELTNKQPHPKQQTFFGVLA